MAQAQMREAPLTAAPGAVVASSPPNEKKCSKKETLMCSIGGGTFLLVVIAVIWYATRGAGGGSPLVSGAGFNCSSDLAITGLQQMDKKGLCVDDTTLFTCPNRLLAAFPHTSEPVKYIRLFKARTPDASASLIKNVRENIVAFCKNYNVKVLVGAQITCDQSDDAKDWAYVQQLITELGSDHVLGLAVGNELNELWSKSSDDVPSSCLSTIWGGYAKEKTIEYIAWARETLGNPDLPVTSVFTGGIIYHSGPTAFVDDSNAKRPDGQLGDNMVQTYLNDIYDANEKNFVFVMNYYPIFDPSNKDDTQAACDLAVQQSACFDQQSGDSISCLTTHSLYMTRQTMTRYSSERQITMPKLWIGEIGWSAPKPTTTQSMGNCKAFYSSHMLYNYYSKFLQWDLSIGEGLAPDLVFYFTMRDSLQFGQGEHFGLVDDCTVDAQGSGSCKLTQADAKGDAPSPLIPPVPAPSPGGCCADATATLDCCQRPQGCCPGLNCCEPDSDPQALGPVVL